MDFRSSKLADRYRNDAGFHEVVQAMEKMISQHGFTPSEMREALFMAHYRYEMENPEAINQRFALAANELFRLHGLSDK